MATTFTTWNPSDCDIGITLSDGNLKATRIASTYKAVRSIVGVSSGKWYWEVHTVRFGEYKRFEIGIADSTVALNANISMSPHGYAYDGQHGRKKNNGAQTAYGDPYDNATIGVALDMDAGKIWWSKDGVWQASGDPAAGTNEAFSGIAGVFFAAFCGYETNSYGVANFGASAFDYPVPSGFNLGLYSSGHGVFKPAANSDDGRRYGATGFDNDLLYDYLGDDGGVDYKHFIRFQDVTIPKSAVIQSAFIRFVAQGQGTTAGCHEQYVFNDVDDAVAPTSYAEFDALVPTTATVAWNNVELWWEADAGANSIDISTLVQEIVDRDGWSPGNALMAVGDGAGSSNNAKRAFLTYENGVSDAAGLQVSWIDPPITIDADVTNPSMSALLLQGSSISTYFPMPTVFVGSGIAAEPSIPMMTPIIVGHDDITHIEATATIPPMSADITQAASISGIVTFPSMSADITEREAAYCEVSIPMMAVDMRVGARASIEDVSIPMTTMEGFLGVRSEASIPMMTVEMEGMTGSVADASAEMPMMTAEITGKTEYLADGAVTVPAMRASARLMTGSVIEGSATIPMMGATLSSYEDIDGDIGVSIPMMEAYLVGTAERAECEALRYVEPEL